MADRALPVDIHLAYWRSLLRARSTDPRLLPGLNDELRAALRDALHEIESARATVKQHAP